ncbi:MAG: DUF177 domain-containing protein [Candidatus Omnitrophota bacterium]
MKIQLARLSDGQEVDFFQEWDPKKLEIDIEGLEFKGLLNIKVFAKRDSGIVNVHVHIGAPVELTCARCLDKFDGFCDKSFRLIYSVDLAKEDIVLDDNIRQELILSYPQKILCRHDCRGLCSRCGSNLNRSVCKCKTKED